MSDYDHHCYFLNSCITSENYRAFMWYLGSYLLLIVHFLVSATLIPVHQFILPFAAHVVVIGLSGLPMLFLAALIFRTVRRIAVNVTVHASFMGAN